ncbi:MAG: hypothetical protein JXR91_10610, partial [Deltaproteobacteria bacterium]|nr:hypothetical protein [Deltaproteobacteria bacterium]
MNSDSVSNFSHLQSDTISAVATARGQAALGIIRISGSDSASVLKKVIKGVKHLNTNGLMNFG